LNYLVLYQIIYGWGARRNLVERRCWRRRCLSSKGFADTSLRDLERAIGVSKSGLYTEFRGKEDPFVACLRHYLESQEKRGLLTNEPLVFCLPGLLSTHRKYICVIQTLAVFDMQPRLHVEHRFITLIIAPCGEQQ
jgi:AcrR family transcriptional regulator